MCLSEKLNQATLMQLKTTWLLGNTSVKDLWEHVFLIMKAQFQCA